MQAVDTYKKEARSFLQEEYTPEMLRRQPPIEATASKTSTALTGKQPETLQSRLWPTMPATPSTTVQSQKKRVEGLEKDMTVARLRMLHMFAAFHHVRLQNRSGIRWAVRCFGEACLPSRAA